VKVNGSPADEYSFRPAAAQITYSITYELECARVYAGIPLLEWERMPGTRAWLVEESRCKCDILILFRMSQFIPAAVSDAQAREVERKSKRKGF
jgi:hypothetical protein